jgi:hypothetical protein
VFLAESWRERLTREVKELEVELRPMLASRLDDKALRDELERLAQRPRFPELTWLWGPVVGRRNRVLFRPFILSNFSSAALDSHGRLFDAWKGETSAALETWLKEVDSADDIELTRRLFGWRLMSTPFKLREQGWREEIVRRFTRANTPYERHTALAKVDTAWMRLDAKTALVLYRHDRAAARRFILDHLPWFGWLGEKRKDWDGILLISRDQDPEFHFDLYRRIVDEKRWREDVVELCGKIADAGALDTELERRHPRVAVKTAPDVLLEAARMRGRDVVPYMLRHVASIWPRFGFFGGRDSKPLSELLALADSRAWTDLWAALLRTSATKDLYEAEIRKLVRSTELKPAEIKTKLFLIAGHGREANLPGVSFAQVHPLGEQTALELYRRFPETMRGAFRMHVAPGWHSPYPKMIRAALDANDRELVDYFASRAAMQALGRFRDSGGWNDTLDLLSAHFEAMNDDEFVVRASNALSRMPAFAIWRYEELLRSNRLARLLFERSTAYYLTSPRAVRDLLESPQIHVQVLAFRVLSLEDPRARAIAAENKDLLQATLFRPLHRRTRLFAFRALENASANDEASARYLLQRMREALTLPEKRYPTEKLVGLIGHVLHRWPSLRSANERPVVYGEVPA